MKTKNSKCKNNDRDTFEKNLEIYKYSDFKIKYSMRLDVSPFYIFKDLLFIGLLFKLINFIDDSSSNKYTNILVVTMIIFILVYSFLTTYNLFYKIDIRLYNRILSKMNNSLDVKLNTNVDGESSKFIRSKNERRITLIDQCLEKHSFIEDILSNAVANIVGAIIASVLLFIITDWSLLSDTNELNIYLGVYLVSILILIIGRVILISSDFKTYHYYSKIMKEIRLDCI